MPYTFPVVLCTLSLLASSEVLVAGMEDSLSTGECHAGDDSCDDISFLQTSKTFQDTRAVVMQNATDEYEDEDEDEDDDDDDNEDVDAAAAVADDIVDGACEDTHERGSRYCEKSAVGRRRGACNRDWMQTDCKKSCGVCAATAANCDSWSTGATDCGTSNNNGRRSYMGRIRLPPRLTQQQCQNLCSDAVGKYGPVCCYYGRTGNCFAWPGSVIAPQGADWGQKTTMCQKSKLSDADAEKVKELEAKFQALWAEYQQVWVDNGAQYRKILSDYAAKEKAAVSANYVDHKAIAEIVKAKYDAVQKEIVKIRSR